MTNNAHLKFREVRQLVRNHRADIVKEHGHRELLLWRLRVLRAFLEWQGDWAKQRVAARDADASRLRHVPYTLYAQLAHRANLRLTSWLKPCFEQLYF